MDDDLMHLRLICYILHVLNLNSGIPYIQVSSNQCFGMT